jgi:hypothetical protein
MQRLRLYDCRNSRLPTLVGLCHGDVPTIAQYVNAAQRRLLLCKESGDEGWWGTWAEMAFTVSRPSPGLPGPYLTVPREVARLEAINLCEFPIPIQNQFYEYLRFGNGRLPKTFRRPAHDIIRQAFSRNNVPTFVDITNPPQYITAVATNAADIESGKRVLIQMLDNNNNPVYSQDGLNQVLGQFYVLQSPFVSTSPVLVNQITGIQKDITIGEVKFYQVNPTTGEQVLLLTMQPGEQTAWYRRYYFDDLPFSCCFDSINQNLCGTPSNTPKTLTVTAICKLDLIPVVVDTDYCLLQNLEAITEECQSVRLSEVDNQAGKGMAAERHLQAVRMLIGELTHYLGKDEPAVEFTPWGNARLERQKIGTML